MLHEFKGLVMPRNRGHFRYSTQDIMLEMYFKNFDDKKTKLLGARTDVTEYQEDSLQRTASTGVVNSRYYCNNRHHE